MLGYPGPSNPKDSPPPPPTGPRWMGLNRGPPPPGFASADTPPGEGAIRMGQRYHCHNKCCTLGAAVGVMSSGKPHQSQDLPTWSSGLVARPCVTLCIMSRTMHHSPCASDAVAQCGTCSTGSVLL